MLYKCTVSNAPKTWLQPRIMSDICRVFHAQKTCLPSKGSMSGSCEKGVYSFLYIKDVVLSKDIYIRILSDSCSGFHAPNTWLQARVSVSGYCQAVIQAFMHQRVYYPYIFPPLKTDIQSE